MEHASRKRFPVDQKDYKLYEEIGEGVSATVYRALCIPFNEIVAIKVLDLEKCNNDFDGIRREVQTMSLIDHPNVLRAHCSFTAGYSLWVVMPYMAGGSCLHIIKSAYPEGFEEPVIATLLREVLKALVYLHGHGHIHRDVKAGNILIDTNGTVKLADFGVSACMFDTGDRQRSRNTFVGTPCWMAPEVMQQLHGYDFKADIWSFGITALELAHGHAPFSKYPPMKVLLMTLQNAPPGLDYERDKRFSKSFKDMVATCLVKDPKKRPTSEKLLKHNFFKHARSTDYLMKTILDSLSPLGDRFKKLKAKEAEVLLQNKAMYEDKEHISQQEYIKGISAWNFNLEDLKAQAALIDDADISALDGIGTVHKTKNGFNNVGLVSDVLSSQVRHANSTDTKEGELHELENFEESLASSFPIRPLQALKGLFDVCDDETGAVSPLSRDAEQSISERDCFEQKKPQMDSLDAKCNTQFNSEQSSVHKDIVTRQQKFLSGSILPERVPSPCKNSSGRDGQHSKMPLEKNYSGPLMCRPMRDAHYQASATSLEETSEGRVVQRKGRFKVTSADAGHKGLSSTNSMSSPSSRNSANINSSLFSLLQFILQQNSMQKEQIAKLISCIEKTSGCEIAPSVLGIGDPPQFSPASNREKELRAYLVQLQQSITNLVEEIQRLKVQNAQLQQQLNAVSRTEKKDKQIV